MSNKFGKLSTRIFAALIGIPLIILLTLLGKIWFLFFVMVIAGASFTELTKMIKHKHNFVNYGIGLISTLAIVINSYSPFVDLEYLMTGIVLVTLLAELFRNRSSAISNLGVTFLSILYIGFFSSAIIQIREFYSNSTFTYFQGGYLIIALFGAIWFCDSAAYFIGSAYGKNRLMPRVSPKKSWEGAVAGFIFSIIAMLFAAEFALDFLTRTDAIIIGIIVGLFGQIGDLIESLLKRDANVKDSSSIIPGHGGVLDRFDSLLFSAPLIYLYLRLIN
ncbi:MAG: phosphatidate cytidylyltransferase [Melioribacteraceae bacterium]|nr:phosphatidate cytidylyltransferase [Melioribacteraceae bacterium]